MLTDAYPQVRVEAIFAIADVLDGLDEVPFDESRLLVDYVLPRLVSRMHSRIFRAKLQQHFIARTRIVERFNTRLVGLRKNGARFNAWPTCNHLA